SNLYTPEIIDVGEENILKILKQSYKKVSSRRNLKKFELSDYEQLARVFLNTKTEEYQKLLREFGSYALKPIDKETEQLLHAFGFGDRGQRNIPLISSLQKTGEGCMYALGIDGIYQLYKMDLEKVGKSSFEKSELLFDFYSHLDTEFQRFLRQGGYDPSRQKEFFQHKYAYFDDYVAVLSEFAKLISSTGENLPVARKQNNDYSDNDHFVLKANFNVVSSGEKSEEASSDRAFLTGLERKLLLSTLDFDKLAKEIKGEVIGQDEAVDEIMKGLVLYATDSKESHLPLNYFTTGPTGVGKNYAFEIIAKRLENKLGIEVPYRNIECSNYQSEGSVNQLIGAPMGYVGHDERSGALTSFFENAGLSPLSIIIFDEFEKANQGIVEFLLPALDRGGVYDNYENYLDFSGMILGFTSNIGYSELRGSSGQVGFTPDKKSAKEAASKNKASESMEKTFPPEFISRINVVHFNSLNQNSIDKILELQINGIKRQFQNTYSLNIEVDDDAKSYLLKKGYSEKYGARFLKSCVQNELNVPVSQRVQQDLKVNKDGAREALEYIRELKNSGSSIDQRKISEYVQERTNMRLPYDSLKVKFGDNKLKFSAD
ncbi:MAG: AAA family ATPase, partial [Nanoarchaeota archaeon]